MLEFFPPLSPPTYCVTSRSLLLYMVVYTQRVVAQQLESFPKPCPDTPPVNILEYAIPSPKSVPRGVNLLYDHHNHVHGFQFSAQADDLLLGAEKVFRRCQYFPYEFSLFITYKLGVAPKREQCVFALLHAGTKKTLISLGLWQHTVVFRFKERRYSFRMSHGRQDRNWHTLSVSMSSRVLAVTKDCRSKQQRSLRREFPDLLPVLNTSFIIGKCSIVSPVFMGLLKSVILLPGRDAAVQACKRDAFSQHHLDDSILTSPGLSSLTYHQTGPGVCEWSDVGNIAFDVHAGKLKVCVNGVWRDIKVKSDKRRLDYLVPHQVLDTGQGSLDVEVFELPGEGKFAVFALTDARDQRSLRSRMYQWVNGQFTFYQWLPTQSAQSWEFFSIHSQFFLAVANYGSLKSVPSNSTIFKWNKKSRKFVVYQNIQTYTARDIEAFEINGEYYLAIANHAQDGNSLIDSVVYKWSWRHSEFLEHQPLPTIGAYDWTHFTVDDYHFLVVANAFTGESTLAFSVLYIWQGDKWVEFQTMETVGATDWEYFRIGADHYLAVANAFNFGSQNFQEIDSYRTNSTIYKLDRSKNVFTKYQSISTNSAVDWEYLNIGTDHYLMVSNAQNGGTGERLLSVMYRWQGLDKFVPVHYLHTGPNVDIEVFTDHSNVYVIYANVNSTSCEIVKVKFV